MVPVFPAFTTAEKLDLIRKKGAVFFGIFNYEDGKQVGFVAIEKQIDGYYMERLSVLPKYRHHGLGFELVNFVIAYVTNKGENKLHLTMDDENKILKKWYLEIGFKVKSVRHFKHLPFKVCSMELVI